LGSYILEQILFILVGWIPTVIGLGLRGVLYRLILKMNGWAAIENKVRLRFANNIQLGNGVYLDQNAYLHACPNGIQIGENTIIMYGAVLHVYNFRDLPNAGIKIGRDSLIGEYTVIRGQGGVSIGDRVYTSPFTQIIAVNHVFDDPVLDRSSPMACTLARAQLLQLVQSLLKMYRLIQLSGECQPERSQILTVRI